MARKTRKKAEREAHLKQIQIWYCQGMLQAEIAQELGISQQQVSYDLKALQKRWHEQSMQAINTAKAKELAKIDALEQVYWQAWIKSCEDAETKTQKQKGTVKQYEDEDGAFVSESPSERIRTLKGQSGDPRFLQGVQWCIQQRVKIMGVEAAIKHINFDIDLENCTVEQLARLASGENPLNVVGTQADQVSG